MKKSYRKWLIIASSLLCLSLLLFLIYSIQTQKETKVVHMVYIPKLIDETNDFWTALIEGANMAAKDYDIDLVIDGGSNETDYEDQNRRIQKAIDSKADVIAVSPISYTNSTEMVKKVKESGIKLIFVDSGVDEDVADALIATDNFAAGMKMGKFMQQSLNEDSQIAIVSHVKDASTAIDRERGLRAGIGPYEDQIVEVVYCDSNYQKAYRLTKELLEKYPDLDYIAGLNEYSAVGAARAVDEIQGGASQRVKVIGFDNSLEQIKFLEKGVFQAIVVQKSFNMGYLAVETALKVLKGEKVPPVIDSGSELITKDNMYTEQNQKLLFPFFDK